MPLYVSARSPDFTESSAAIADQGWIQGIRPPSVHGGILWSCVLQVVLNEWTLWSICRVSSLKMVYSCEDYMHVNLETLFTDNILELQTQLNICLNVFFFNACLVSLLNLYMFHIEWINKILVSENKTWDCFHPFIVSDFTLSLS